jgi:hypothetical protein
MKLVNVAWVFGGLAAISLGMAAQACSSSSNPNNSQGPNCATLASECCSVLTGAYQTACTGIANGGSDSTCAAEITKLTTPVNSCTGGSSGTGSSTGSSSGSSTGSNTGSGSGSPGSSTGSGSTDAGTGSGSCEAPPTKVYAETAGEGLYCPFSVITDAGKAGDCPVGDHCCEPASGTSTCVATGTACASGDTDWQCEGPLDCTGAGAAGPLCCGTGTIETSPACGSNPAYPYVSKFTGSACAASCAASFTICSQQSECTTGTCTPIKPKGNTIGYCATGSGS